MGQELHLEAKEGLNDLLCVHGDLYWLEINSRMVLGTVNVIRLPL